MSRLSRLFRLASCALSQHDTVRERRTHRGVPHVLGFSCVKCGTWLPALERTTAEYARIQRLGAVRRPRVKAVQP